MNNALDRIWFSTWYWLISQKPSTLWTGKGYWTYYKKLVYPDHLVRLIYILYEGIKASVSLKDELSECFKVGNGVKQRHVLALTKFSICLSLILSDACTDSTLVLLNRVNPRLTCSMPMNLSLQERPAVFWFVNSCLLETQPLCHTVSQMLRNNHLFREICKGIWTEN